MHMENNRFLVTLLALAAWVPVHGAGEIYVDPMGSDDNPGTEEKPFKTIARAQQAARTLKGGEGAVTVFLRGGTYYLDEPIVFTPEDSGTEFAPVTYTAYPGERPVISGGARLTLEWEPYRDGIMKAQVSTDHKIDQLFINGEKQRMARYPNYDPDKKTDAYRGYSADAFSKEKASEWSDPKGGYMHVMHFRGWGGHHYRITGKDDQGELTCEGGWQNNRPQGIHPEHRMVENIFEELDAPNEWFYDRKAKILYFYPPEGLDLEKALVEIVLLPNLFEFRGEFAGTKEIEIRGETESFPHAIEDPVRHIILRDLELTQTARTFMENDEPLLRSDWTISRTGAILLEGTANISIIDTKIHQVGGNAIFVSNYNSDTVISGCHIRFTGGSGICFVGVPTAVRNPLFHYDEILNLADLDRTPGPRTEDYPRDGLVDDCLVHEIGMIERQTAAIQISMARRITIRDCSIYETTRAGINFSEGTWGGHIIEGCDVFDTVLETHDHGSFNSWGRDRFWHVPDATHEQKAELVKLDALETNIIRDSRWRCDHGWDIDLDDGSSNYEIYNNLMLNGGLKLREGFYRRAFNNITVNSTLSPHVWYDHNRDAVHGNIWMREYRSARNSGNWAEEIDRNFFTAVEDLRAYQGEGADARSLAGDPQFVAPEAGDYRVKEGSPAMEVGFQNFQRAEYGVRDPRLRAIARTPKLPKLELVAVGADGHIGRVRPKVVFGALAIGLSGDDFSAFGVTQEDGGVHLLEVEPNSIFAKAGLQNGDVIQQIDGVPTKTHWDLRVQIQEAKAAGRSSVKVSYIREQAKEKTTIPFLSRP